MAQFRITSKYSLKQAINAGNAMLSEVAPFFLKTLFALVNAGKITTCCGDDDQIITWANASNQDIGDN